jgi:Flp pilus assembly protein TadG
MKNAPRIRRDDRGTAVIEMGLAAPILAVLLIGMVDLSRGYSAKLQLTQAAQRSIEKIMQGTQNTTVFQALKTEAATAAGVPEANVTVDWWLECNGTRQTNYDTTCPSGQNFARYLNVRITKNFKPMFNTRYAGFRGPNSDGSYNLVGQAGIRVQ